MARHKALILFKRNSQPKRRPTLVPPASISSVPPAVPTAPVGQPITSVGLAGSLNDAFRGMIQKTGKHCNAITDHVWVTPEHISVMCDRRLRAAFIREQDGWRLGRPGE